MNVFIDTNIYLTFYHLTNDDLEELRKVFALLRTSKIKVWLPEQVIDEFNRNREVKIADALKRFKEEKMNNQIPQMVKQYPEYDDLKNSMRNYEIAKSTLIDRIQKDVANKCLKADEIISEIFAKAEKIAIDVSLLAQARIRLDRGNPPGKNKSYGDAIIWEALLASVPQFENLHIIADDSDYYSPLNVEELDSFLSTEWAYRKFSSIYIYKRLSQFLAKNFPLAIIATELEKEILIKELAESGTFKHTHQIIRNLSNFYEFTGPQVNDVVNAYLTNNQVNWIIGDEDVLEFIERLVMQYREEIEAESFEQLSLLIETARGANESPQTETVGSDIPL